MVVSIAEAAGVSAERLYFNIETGGQHLVGQHSHRDRTTRCGRA